MSVQPQACMALPLCLCIVCAVSVLCVCVLCVCVLCARLISGCRSDYRAVLMPADATQSFENAEGAEETLQRILMSFAPQYVEVRVCVCVAQFTCCWPALLLVCVCLVVCRCLCIAHLCLVYFLLSTWGKAATFPDRQADRYTCTEVQERTCCL